MSKPILCVDFDGVVHAYTSKWTDAMTISDGPVPGALKWLWQATEWFHVAIYSSRSKEAGAIIVMRARGDPAGLLGIHRARRARVH